MSVLGEIVDTTEDMALNLLEGLRLDSYFSKMTGLGGKSDKTTAIDFQHTQRFVDASLVNQYYAGDGVAARVVDLIVDSAMSPGWSVEFSSAGANGETVKLDPTESAALNNEIKTWEKKIGLYREVNKWWKRGRAHGGSLMVFGLDDGVEDKAEALKSGGDFDWIRVLTRWEVQPSSFYGDDPKDPITFGMPVDYTLHPNRYDEDITATRVHATRVYRFEGIQVDDPLAGGSVSTLGDTFGDSVFERIWNPLKLWNSALQGAGHIIQDFAQSVYAIDGFRKVLRMKGGRGVLFDQFAIMDTFRSMFKATVIDAKDTYERKTTTVAGMPDLIDKFGHQLSAVSAMPLTKLIGISPGGFGTGESEDNGWDKTTDHGRQEILGPMLERVYTILFESRSFKGRVPDTWRVVFSPLKQMSDADQAELQNKQADTDQKNIDSGMYTPDEAAQSRYGRHGFSLETQLDQESRDEFEESEEDIDGEVENAKKEGGGAEVAKTAMNGAQITSLMAIATAVAAKTLPRDSAIAILMTAYQIGIKEATDIVGSSGEGFDPNAKPPTPEPVTTPNGPEERPKNNPNIETSKPGVEEPKEESEGSEGTE